MTGQAPMCGRLNNGIRKVMDCTPLSQPVRFLHRKHICDIIIRMAASYSVQILIINVKVKCIVKFVERKINYQTFHVSFSAPP